MGGHRLLGRGRGVLPRSRAHVRAACRAPAQQRGPHDHRSAPLLPRPPVARAQPIHHASCARPAGAFPPGGCRLARASPHGMRRLTCLNRYLTSSEAPCQAENSNSGERAGMPGKLRGTFAKGIPGEVAEGMSGEIAEGVSGEFRWKFDGKLTGKSIWKMPGMAEMRGTLTGKWRPLRGQSPPRSWRWTSWTISSSTSGAHGEGRP